MKFLWTTIQVGDMEKSIEFYTDLAGLKVLQRFNAGPDMELAFLGNGSDGETLLELAAHGESTAISYKSPVSIGFETESLEEMQVRAAARGIAVTRGSVETPSGSFFFVEDPDGFMVQFFQH